MTHTPDRLVGTSFRPGYRYQRYWDTSMARAFFAAETGTGLFVVSIYLDYLPGMLLGLALALILKPWFHLAHMGVPSKSWRALARPDRSWVSRGALAIGALALFGGAHVIDRFGGGVLGPELASLARYGALAAACVTMCYQGFAMADSESFALWASPLIPLLSFLYASSAGVLTALALAGDDPANATLRHAGVALLLLDGGALAMLLAHARRKSPGGAFSAELLLHGRFARPFRYLVLLLGLALPVLALLAAGTVPLVRALAAVAMLAGFYTLRLLLLRAAVYEPVSHGLAARIALPGQG